MQKSKLQSLEKGKTHKVEAKPFVKWAGGKTQLLDELASRLPFIIKESKSIERYVEPFVGGGAFFFYLKGNYEVKEAFLYDINVELIVGYKVIQKDVHDLICQLEKIEKEYLKKKRGKSIITELETSITGSKKLLITKTITATG